MSLKGKCVFYGAVRIGGVFKGEIFTSDILIISEGAKVDAIIDAGVIIISGEVSGKLRARHRIEIHKPAIFIGEIITPSLSVEDGVHFEGRSQMSQSLSASGASLLQMDSVLEKPTKYHQN